MISKYGLYALTTFGLMFGSYMTGHWRGDSQRAVIDDVKAKEIVIAQQNIALYQKDNLINTEREAKLIADNNAKDWEIKYQANQSQYAIDRKKWNEKKTHINSTNVITNEWLQYATGATYATMSTIPGYASESNDATAYDNATVIRGKLEYCDTQLARFIQLQNTFIQTRERFNKQ